MAKPLTTDSLRCYDNGGKTADRYTILPPRWASKGWRWNEMWMGVGCNERPFHPQGIGGMVTAMAGRHLGKRVEFSSLPNDVRAYARTFFNAEEVA